MSVTSAACDGAVPRHGFEELPCPGHREWQDQPVRLGEVQRLLGRLSGGALITQVAAFPLPGQLSGGGAR
jgi:hypothetical protein